MVPFLSSVAISMSATVHAEQNLTSNSVSFNASAGGQGNTGQASPMFQWYLESVGKTYRLCALGRNGEPWDGQIHGTLNIQHNAIVAPISQAFKVGVFVFFVDVFQSCVANSEKHTRNNQ